MGFSLVEVTLSLGIIGFALIAVLGLVPVALDASKEAADDTRTSLIAKDVFTRIRSSIALDSDPIHPGNPDAFETYTTNSSIDNALTQLFYYDQRGIRLDQTGATSSGEPVWRGNFFRAEVNLGPLVEYPPGLTPEDLLAVTVRIRWPVEPVENGEPYGASNEAAVYSFLLRRP